ncbi:hypothetical protein [Caloramator sp. Dgby_cultured_2]|uniref:hypothetical protein n=1 Tax=Caloramator sp. Dgby_cultured_2 TaxID=3029174 RepID=UPI00237E7438|nr:hypothetical protein [Caloramator sp. Dgby_cultured_2]WDU82618.1 hypothetical protein PWK10_13755 [Caloramator sp. Dgby_cultured_2]
MSEEMEKRIKDIKEDIKKLKELKKLEKKYEKLKREKEEIEREIQRMMERQNKEKKKGIRGGMMLREVDCKEWQIVFVRTLQEYLYKKGFKNLIEIRYNKEGKLYTIKNKKLYIDTEKVEGRPFEIDGEKNIKEFCKVLSEFHGASEGFVPPQGLR